MAQFMGESSLIAGEVAAIGASVCYVGPLLLLALSIGDSWVGSLTAMEPYRPMYIRLSLLFFGMALRKLYQMPQVCAPSSLCANPRKIKWQRLTFWIVSIAIFGLLALPALVP